MNKNIITLPLFLLTLGVAACSGTGSPTTGRSESSMNPYLRTSAINKVMENALTQAEESGNAQETLSLLKQVHINSPKDPIVATRYARALREDEQINMAIRTLQPFTEGADESIEAVTEMAMTQISLGDFEAAELYAEQATNLNSKNARAYLAMGTAQDAQGRHQDAEISFRQGLKYWKGDASPILNNLALNLASQGHLTESLALLEKAQKLAPHRIELERNRRIIATLLETVSPQPAPPVTKPKADTAPSTDSEKKTEISVENNAKVSAEKSTPTPKTKPVKAEEKPSSPPKDIQADIKKETKEVINKTLKPQPTYKASEQELDTKPTGTKFNIKLKPLSE